jgi:hypothetical protein
MVCSTLASWARREKRSPPRARWLQLILLADAVRRQIKNNSASPRGFIS